MKPNSSTIDMTAWDVDKPRKFRVRGSIAESSRTTKKLRALKELLIEASLFLCASVSVLTTFGIAFVLVKEAIPFFAHVSIWDFLTGTEWTPLFANGKFGILPLLCGTLLATLIALCVAIPFGSIIAIFMSEYCGPKTRTILKPVLELLSAVPTVVYGYFALLFVSPLLQILFPSISGFNVLAAGLVMGIMIVPYVASLSEDAMRSVPMYLREGSYAMGATRLQTAFGVVVPSAFSGITSAYILAISRAIGETMVVAIAAGMQPSLSMNPLAPAQTITAFIVQVSLGDLPHGTVGYQSIFAAGLVLMIVTLIFNILGHFLRKRFRERY